MKQYSWKKCLKPKDLVVGNFYLFNDTRDYISVSLYLGRNKDSYYFYSIMPLNSVNRQGIVTLTSDAQLKHIPDMIDEVLKRSISTSNLTTTKTITGRLLDVIPCEFKDFNTWYLKNRLQNSNLPDLVATQRPGYARVKDMKNGHFYYNGDYMFYVERFDPKDKENTQYYRSRYYTEYLNLIQKQHKDLDEFIADFKKISQLRCEKLPSVRVLTDDTSRNYVRSFYYKLCKLQYQE